MRGTHRGGAKGGREQGHRREQPGGRAGWGSSRSWGGPHPHAKMPHHPSPRGEGVMGLTPQHAAYGAAHPASAHPSGPGRLTAASIATPIDAHRANLRLK